LDNDGSADLVVSNINSPPALLRNIADEAAAPPHHWLGIKLAGRGHRDLVGSTVVLEGSTRKLTRFAKGGGSYLSAGDQRILFGLGRSEEIRSLTVRWSWGETQVWKDLEPGRYYELREEEADAVQLSGARSSSKD
jgi:hypothetical protein